MRRLALTCAVLCVAACAASNKQQQDRDLRKDIASQLIGQQDWPTAFQAVARLQREEPDDPDVLFMRGIIYREQMLYAEAEADLLAVIKISPERAAVHAALAILYDSIDRAKDALAAHRRAAQLNPQDASYLNNLGFSLFAHRSTREAIDAFKAALRVDPTSRRVRNNLGFAYAREGDFAAALKEFQTAGSAGQARNNLGFAYEQEGNLAAAYELYVEALALEPALRMARRNLAHVAPIIGRPGPEALGLPPIGEQSDEQSQRGEDDASAERLD